MIDVLTWVGWNSLLALIPVGLGYAFARLARQRGLRGSLLVQLALLGIGVLWLAFLPNSCYLLTEWRHFLELLRREDLYTQWTMAREPDALLRMVGSSLFIFIFSMFGMLTFALAIRPVARVLRQVWRNFWLLAIIFFPLISLGVYLGLVKRFNSWDLLHRPSLVWAAVMEALMRPRLFALILLFGFFLWLAYLIIDIWIDGFLWRFRRSPVTPPAASRAAEVSQ
jgi:uncharacterized membrane protein